MRYVSIIAQYLAVTITLAAVLLTFLAVLNAADKLGDAVGGLGAAGLEVHR